MAGKRPTAPEWTDTLGQVFRPGDLIAVATVNDKSPQMVIARVERINLTNAKGERLVRSIPTGRKETRTRPEYIGPRTLTRLHPRDPGWREQVEEQNRLRNDPANWREVQYEVDEYHEVQAATVTAIPVKDGRGFYRTGSRSRDEGKKPKAVTYSLTGNIVKLPDHVTEETIPAPEGCALPRVERKNDEA